MKNKMNQNIILIIMSFLVFSNTIHARTNYGTIPDQITNKTISGIVTDEFDGAPLIGVSVQIKGKTIGTITDFDGKYSIEISNTDQFLIFSYVGMKTTTKTIELSELNVIMETDAFGLDEIVVSGVASATPRKNLTISVEKVDAEIMKGVHASSAINALQGKVAGLKIVSANGLPGSGASVRLRASTSLTGNNKPLIILDGNRLKTNLADINLDDIASYEVVKGAAAAALYGSEAGNGVIVLISKRGKKLGENTTKVTLRSEIGYQKIANYLEVSQHHPYQLVDNWNEYDYTKYKGVFYFNGIKISGSRLVTENGYADQPFINNYNHQDLFFKKGSYHTEYIGIIGQGTKSNYLLSFENNNQGGIIRHTDGYQRNNIKFNMDRHIGEKFTLSTSNLFVKTISSNPSSYRTFQDVLFLSPDVDLLALNSDSTSYLIEPDIWKDGLVKNPLYPLANKKRNSKRTSVIGNIKLSYFITDWLTAETKYAYEYRVKQWTTITPKKYYIENGKTTEGALYKQDFTELGQDLQFTLNFNKKINDFTNRIKLSYLYENTENETFNASGQNFFVDDIPNFNNIDPTTAKFFSAQQKIVSINYFGIYDLDYKSKYIFSALYRIDGSSLFGSEERWNPYYRVSGAYRITEDYEIPHIDELKFRMAYGTSGQRPSYHWRFETLKIRDGNVPTPDTQSNKFLKPSNTGELEFGINADFFSRFSLNLTYAITTTKDAIRRINVPSQYGFSGIYQNIGTIKGTSFEASLIANLVQSKDFNWTMNLSFDRLRQTVDKLDIPAYFDGPRNAFYVAPGESFGIIYGSDWVKSLEQMKTQLPADKTIEDYEINSEGYVIPKDSEGSINEIPINVDVDMDGNADKVAIGNGNSNFDLSMNNSLSYKGISLGFLFSWKNGGDVYNFTRQNGYRDYSAKEIDQSDKAEDKKKTINYYGTLYNKTGVNSHFIEDGSYLKLRELSLGYLLNGKNLGRIKNHIKTIRVGIQIRNVFTITDYSGYDPEVASGNDLTNYPFDNFGYPNFRTYSASIKLSF